ncbi:MAG: DUF4080 domain-containing protein [Desulfurivibrionaceae bacterium]|nr:DUF4080 domain-containing protein [Desulfurivibrionaceae bacterium]
MNFKLVALNGRYIHSCLALFYLRQELKKQLPAAAIELRQFTINDPYYKTLLKIGEGAPGVLFFSVYIWNGELIKRLLADLAAILPETSFVLGGPQAAAFARQDLPTRCTVIGGEIEGIDPAFYQDLERGELAPHYNCTPGRPFPSPYTDDDLSTELLNRHVYYESSRGCPFSCTYCLSSVERGVHRKEPAQVEAELTAILRHRPKIIKFVDRTFNDKPERAMAIWRFLAARESGTVFHFEMAPDLFNEEMFAFLEELSPGRFQFELGVQSTNPATLAAVNRVMDLDKVGENIRRLARLNNIHLHADLILGLPEETETTFRNSLNDLFAMGPHYIQMGLLKVLPTTRISRTKGLRHCAAPPYEVLATAEMSPATLARLYWLGECVESFHNNRYFPSLFAYLRERREDIAAFFDNLLAVCRQHNFFGLAATQTFLCELLLESVGERPDFGLIKDLLRYDWLRCGHRFIPEFLQKENLNELRKKLQRDLDRELPLLFTRRNRDEFFRKTVFAEFSGPALKQLGFTEAGKGSGVICFLPRQSASIHGHLETILLPGLSKR